MILWHVGLTPWIVWQVFHDPRMDFRFLVVGSLLPDLIDVAFGHAAVAHSLVSNVGVLALVMVVTRRRSAWRSALLALVIGSLLHLLLDGMWKVDQTFWWPFRGSDFADTRLWPRGWHAIAEEGVGAVAAWLWIARFSLGERERRRTFIRTGHVTPPEVG